MVDSHALLRESLLADLDHELVATRHLLERIPDAAFAWAPHERSFTLGGLATHLATLPMWGQRILEEDGHDLGAAGSPRQAALPTRADVLSRFDENVRAVRASLTTMSDAALQTVWTLRRGPRIMLTVPKFSALRTFLLHHLIHHRGQLTVYLRLQGIPLPPLYGPTADDAR